VIKDVTSLKGDVSTLIKDVTIVKRDVTILIKDVTSLKGDVTTVIEDVTSFKGDVNNHKRHHPYQLPWNKKGDPKELFKYF
jgi:hypothetical protein